MVTHGWAIAESGDPARGIAQIGRAREALDAAGSSLRVHLDVVRAQCHLQLGQIEEGLEAVSAALVYMEASEERVFAAEINRLKGELLARDGAHGEEAGAAFRTAIAIAQSQRAKSWELRATMSLARWLAAQGRRDEARATLAEIYNWFTEGFDTADLKDAKALLDELRA
jgi:predicted ATPase